MRRQVIKATAGGFAVAFVAAAVSIPPASATSNAPVPFDKASFNGYATGTELHVGTTALGTLGQATGLNLVTLDQALSSATTDTAGLTTALTSELGTAIQPPEQAAIKAYDEGTGLNLDLGTLGSSVNTAADSLVSLAGSAIPGVVSRTAPPNIVPAASSQFGPLNLDPVLNASNLVGQAEAAFPQASCPTSDISYGLGNLTAANILTGLPALTSSGVATAPLISTVGNGTSVSQTKSVTLLNANGDGTYGIQTQASDIIAPITINLLGLATLQIAVHSAGGVNDPVTLTATTTGEDHGAAVKLSTDDLLTVVLTAAGQAPQTLANVPLSTIGPNGLHIPLSISNLTQLLSQISVPGLLIQALNNALTSLPSGTPSQVTDAINTVVTALGTATGPVTDLANTIVNQPTVQQLLGAISAILNVSLGSIDVDTTPHAIKQPATTAPTQVGGTQAGGALDLLKINLDPTGTINVGGQTIPANTITGVSQAITIPTIAAVPLPSLLSTDLVAGHLEAQSQQQQPISCASTAATSSPPPPPKLPFTGGPGGLWQPALGIGTLGLGGFSLALVRRLRRRSAV